MLDIQQHKSMFEIQLTQAISDVAAQECGCSVHVILRFLYRNGKNQVGMKYSVEFSNLGGILLTTNLVHGWLNRVPKASIMLRFQNSMAAASTTLSVKNVDYWIVPDTLQSSRILSTGVLRMFGPGLTVSSMTSDVKNSIQLSIAAEIRTQLAKDGHVMDERSIISITITKVDAARGDFGCLVLYIDIVIQLDTRIDYNDVQMMFSSEIHLNELTVHIGGDLEDAGLGGFFDGAGGGGGGGYSGGGSGIVGGGGVFISGGLSDIFDTDEMSNQIVYVFTDVYVDILGSGFQASDFEQVVVQQAFVVSVSGQPSLKALIGTGRMEVIGANDISGGVRIHFRIKNSVTEENFDEDVTLIVKQEDKIETHLPTSNFQDDLKDNLIDAGLEDVVVSDVKPPVVTSPADAPPRSGSTTPSSSLRGGDSDANEKDNRDINSDVEKKEEDRVIIIVILTLLLLFVFVIMYVFCFCQCCATAKRSLCLRCYVFCPSVCCCFVPSICCPGREVEDEEALFEGSEYEMVMKNAKQNPMNLSERNNSSSHHQRNWSHNPLEPTDPTQPSTLNLTLSDPAHIDSPFSSAEPNPLYATKPTTNATTPSTLNLMLSNPAHTPFSRAEPNPLYATTPTTNATTPSTLNLTLSHHVLSAKGFGPKKKGKKIKAKRNSKKTKAGATAVTDGSTNELDLAVSHDDHHGGGPAISKSAGVKRIPAARRPPKKKSKKKEFAQTMQHWQFHMEEDDKKSRGGYYEHAVTNEKIFVNALHDENVTANVLDSMSEWQAKQEADQMIYTHGVSGQTIVCGLDGLKVSLKVDHQHHHDNDSAMIGMTADGRLKSAHEWIKETDPVTGAERYLNLTTGETTLDIPAAMLNDMGKNNKRREEVQEDEEQSSLKNHTKEEPSTTMKKEEKKEEKKKGKLERKKSKFEELLDASDWEEHTDDLGRTYYFNEKTSKSQWEKPVGVTGELRRIEKIDELQEMRDKIRRVCSTAAEDNDMDENSLHEHFGIDLSSHRGEWIEVHDERSGLTAYYNQRTEEIQLKRPKGWVKMLSQEINKEQVAQFHRKR